MPTHRIAERSARRLLTDRVRLVDALTSATMSEVTLKAVDEADSTLWEGPAQVTARASARSNDTAGAQAEMAEYSLLVPLDAPIVAAGVIVYVVDADDAEFVGERFEVVRTAPGTSSILRRYILTQTKPRSAPNTVSLV